MKKGKTISMILTIVMLVLLAGSMVKISKASIDVLTETADDTSTEMPLPTEESSPTLTAEDAIKHKFQIKIKPTIPPVETPAVEEETKTPVLEFPSQEAWDNFNKELKIIEIVKNQIKVEGNKVIYTAVNEDEEDNDKKDIYFAETYNAVIIFDEKGSIESKTYTKQYSEKETRTTIVKPKEGTEKSWRNDLLDYIITGIDANGDKKNAKRVGINKEMGITDVSYKYEKDVYIYSATLKDGSKGTLREDGVMFTYDAEEGSNFKRTLQLLGGGGTLEFYNKNTNEGNLDGTITIIRGSEKLKFYGTFDENDKNEISIKDEKTTLAKVLENGNILTDFDKNGKPQTTYYAIGSFGYGGYVFGRMQEDNSEKIYSAGYVPFAFRIDEKNIIIIDRQKDGTYKYFLNGNEVSEDNPSVKEAKAMVTKSLIGPAFYAAVEAARGGIALSNLLNSWLDIDFITSWRKKTDEFFSETVIGRVISGKWEESVCHSKIEKIPDNIAVVNINNIMGFAAHVEGERSSAIKTNNQTLYFYKITFGVNPYGMGDVTFELLIDGNAVDLDKDGMADKIELEADKTYSGTGENAVVRYKDKIYEEVCIKFYNTEDLNAEFRNSLKNDKLCNKINEVDLSSAEISKPASSTAVSSTSTGQAGW